jgi:tRNA A22 N-methylase
MTAQAELRGFLCKNGYSIIKEAVASEKHSCKLYLVISAVFSGEISIPDPLFLVCGTLPSEMNDNARAYLEHQARSQMKIANGQRASKHCDFEKAKVAEELAAKILEII